MTLKTPRRFAIAVSFPGEHRRFVLNVVTELEKQLGRKRIFYDEWYQHELVGVDGDLKLKRYYREHCEMVVPFFSTHYTKPWCEIEWHSIRAMLKDRRGEDAVIPVHLDGTQIEGWETVDFGIPRKKRSGKKIAMEILHAYRHRHPIDNDVNFVAIVEDGSHPDRGVSKKTALPLPDNRRKRAEPAAAQERSTNIPALTSAPAPKKKNRSTREQSPVRGVMMSRAKKQLGLPVEQLLASDVTRDFILLHNQLPFATSAQELAKKILESANPMDFLRNCVKQDKPQNAEDLDELKETIWRLCQVLTSVCLQISDLSVLAKHLDGDATHAELPTPDLTVAKSQVALIKMVSVDLHTQSDWKLICKEDLPKRRNAVAAFPHPPHVGIYGDGGQDREDIIDVFTDGLFRLLAAHRRHPANVRAALQELTKRDRVYVLVFLPARLSESNFERIHAAYPELILLVQAGSEDTYENAVVLDQINNIRQDFCPKRN